MKLMQSAVVCIAVLYLADAYYCDGTYFHALQDMLTQIVNSY